MYSYGQNGEDVVLDRVFAAVDHGRYIDAGAGHPTIRSISYHFYRQGWRGMLVEPHPDLFRLIRAQRPDDHAYAVALGEKSGGAQLHCTEPWGYSSTDARLIGGRTVARTVDVSQESLMTLLHRASWDLDEDVHFLILDVEGGELRALGGIDLNRVRPWVIVIESIHPVTRTVYRPWRHLLDASGYTRVLFDGVSDFYLAREKAHLSDRFYPPCSTDSYEPYVPRIDAGANEGLPSAPLDWAQLARELPTTASELRDLCRSLMESGIGPGRLTGVNPSHGEALRAAGLTLQLIAARIELESDATFDFHL
jgi:FkbM family methyltransferase